MKTKILFKKESLVGHKSSRLFVFGIMFLTIALALMLPKNVNAATILVPDDYPTIQQAVNSAVTGDMVYVRAGTYYEHVTIDKSLTLQGEDRETTIIDGSGSGMVIYATANYVTISGLTVANGEYGILLIANWTIHHIIIRNVIITSNQRGFNATHSGGHHLIEDCIISNNGVASYAHQFSNSIIRNCEVYGNNGSLSVAWGSNTLITNNEIHHNNGSGVHFDSMFNSIIELNNIHHNTRGVTVGYVGSYNTIRGNIIRQNEKGIIFTESRVRGNKVYHNDIIDNTIQTRDNYGTNIWDNGYPSGGNYYSDYTGEDLNNDGIGDTPYVFANNRDNYPLMQPQNNLPPVAMCQNVIVSANENCEAIVTPAQVDDNSYDPDGDPITLSLAPSGPYQLGETTVTLTVEDDSGDTDQCTATITVLDDTAPVITTIADPINLWPPNHRYATFNLSDFVLSVSDNCSVLLIDDIVISKVTSDEPEDANGGGDGKTTDDMIISNDCKSIQLRKERQGNGNGRVYTVYLELNDANSNTGSGTCQVQVPHNNGQTAIDDGAVYEVFGDCDNKSSFIVENNKSENKINLINYPNPFNRSTTLVFSLEKANKTTLKVYNSLGQEVVVLFDGYAEADQIYELTFKGDGLPEGLYFCHMQSGDLHFTNRLLLAR